MTALQVQHSMQQQEQAPKSPLQQPLRQQSLSSSPKQASKLSGKRSLSLAADATEVEHSGFADLIKEAADAMHQVHLATCLSPCGMHVHTCMHRFTKISNHGFASQCSAYQARPQPSSELWMKLDFRDTVCNHYLM